jgi:hypothetical protein
MFGSIIGSFIQGAMKEYKKVKNTNMRICFRCKLIDQTITEFCMNCKRSVYCNKKCKKKNKVLHDGICNDYIENYPYIKEVISQMEENYKFLEDQVNRQNIKK